MKVRRKAAELRVDLEQAESALLGVLLGDLAALIAEPDLADPVVYRLFPDGYAGDPDAASEFRDLVQEGLHVERTLRVQACIAELPDGGGRVVLDAESADRWLRVLNDLRLALGTRLGVSENDDFDSADQPAQVYQWLSAFQELLVTYTMD